MSASRLVFRAGAIVAIAFAVGQGATASGSAAKVPRSIASTQSGGRCHASQLHVTLALASPGLGHHGFIVRFRDRGGACTIVGYPGVDGLSAQGHRVVSAKRTRSGYLGGLKPGHPIPHVRLIKGKIASALLEWVDGPIQGQSCPAVKSLKVTAPNALTSVVLSPSSLASERLCHLQIHPVVPGKTGQGA
jgi:hypothetical protein